MDVYVHSKVNIMNQSKLVAIAVIAIMLVAGLCGAAIILRDDDNGYEPSVTGNVKVLGNANNDDYIDEHDAELLKELSGKEWNKEKYPYADANNDGVIDSKDVEIVESIINGTDCKVYYYDIYDSLVSVNYPVKHSRIGVSYWQQAELATLLGMWGNVVLASTSTTDSNSHRYDTSHIDKSFKSSKITSELILETKCDLVIASQGKSDVVQAAVDVDPNITSYYVDVSKSSTYVSTVLTLGVLVNENDKAQAYADYVYSVKEKLEDGLSKITEKANVVITMMYENQSTRANIAVECDGTGAADMIGMIANVYDSPKKSTSNYRLDVEKDWFIQNCGKEFDYIIIEQEGTDTKKVNDTYYTPEMYNERFEEAISYYKDTEAYSAGKILGTTYSYNSFGGYANLLYLAYLLYPDVFTQEDGWDALQNYFNEFTTAVIDVRTQGGWYYTGTAYTQYGERLQ